MYYVFLFVIFISNQSLAIQCGGGSVLRSELFGGPQDDSVVSVNIDNNGVFKMAGQTSDGTWTGGSVGSTSPDYWLAVVDTVNNVGSYRILDAGQDNTNNAHLGVSNLCIAGTSEGLDFLSVWSSSVSLSTTPTWTYSGVFTGLNFDEGRAVVCSTEHAILVSAIDALGDSRPQIVVKQFSIVDGTPVQNFTYGGSDRDVPFDATLRQDVLAIVGNTLSTNFPVTSGATQLTKMAGNDAFVMTVNISNGNILFATYYGGNGDEYAYAVSFDNAGYLYVCGYTSSSDLLLPNAFSTTQDGISDAWLGIWSPSGTLVLATLFGSDGADQASQIEVLTLYDSSHLVYLAGTTDGTNFPVQEAFDGNFGLMDAFVLAFRVSADYTSGTLSFSTRHGGSGDDFAYGLSVLDNGLIAIGGSTASSNFPANGTYQGPTKDAFYTVFNCPALIPVPPSPSPSPSPAAPVTCQNADGCYQAQDLAVQYAESTDGGYVPSQVLYPVDVASGTVNSRTSLGVQYNKLEERDASGNVVSTQTFPSDSWQLAVNTEDVGGTPTTVVQFTNNLVSGVNLTVLNYMFEQQTTFNFAGVNFLVDGSSTKSNIKIEGWPFQSTEHTLHMFMNLQILPPPSPVQSTVDGDMTNYIFNTGVSKAQVSVLSLAVVDEDVTQVSSSVSSTEIKIDIPYFEQYVLYDPGYSVLVENDQEQPKKKKEPISMWAYVGAAIGAVVVAGIFTGIMLTFMKNKRRRQRAKSRAAIQHATEQMTHGSVSSAEAVTVDRKSVV